MTKDVAISKQSPFELATYEEVERYAQMVAGSDFAPKDYRGKPGNVIIAMQMGHELGLKPMQAIQNIAVVNGRPMVWGDAALALIRGNKECEYVKEWMDGTIKNGDAIAYCETKRGDEIIRREFSVKQAIQAQLLGSNVWAKYPERMLQMRARGFCLRDSFPDILKGIYIEGEIIEDDDFSAVVQTDSKLGINAVKQVITKSVEPKETIVVEAEIIKEEFINPETGEVTDTVPVEETPFVSIEDVKKAIHAANSLDDLNLAGDLIRSLNDTEKKSMWPIFYARKRALSNSEGSKS